MDYQPTKKEIEAVGNAIVGTDMHPTECSDNVAITLASHFEGDCECPEDQVADDETGWKPWALEREKELRDRMAKAAIIAFMRTYRPTPSQ